MTVRQRFYGSEKLQSSSHFKIKCAVHIQKGMISLVQLGKAFSNHFNICPLFNNNYRGTLTPTVFVRTQTDQTLILIPNIISYVVVIKLVTKILNAVTAVDYGIQYSRIQFFMLFCQ